MIPDLSQGLPAFLTSDPGLRSGYMMVQITAASLVAESRTLAMPASIGSIPTDANQEVDIQVFNAAGMVLYHQGGIYTHPGTNLVNVNNDLVRV